MKKRASKKTGKKKSSRKVVKTENVCDRVCENKVLCWIPRVVALLFILFISLFALDSFGTGESLGMMFLGFLIHLIPSLVLIVALVVAWRCEKIGGWLFILIGVVFTVFFDTYEDIMTFLIISGPLFLVGILFLVSGYRKSKN